jgi:uncharacterized protein involved in type VI secretion and phage assembly
MPPPQGQSGSNGQKLFGKYRGLVTDNQDPKNLGRLRAKVQEVLGDTDTGWALPVAPYAARNEGFYAVPPVGAGVWIEFEAADVERPIWSGTWWGEDQLPKNENVADTKPPLKIWRSEKGMLVAMDDDAQTLTLSDSQGSNLITIKVQESQVRIQATAKVIVHASQIELVDGASHPLVFGDNLLQYLNQLVQVFNSHMHQGQMAAVIPVAPTPPVPQFPPTPSLLSVKVKTG